MNLREYRLDKDRQSLKEEFKRDFPKYFDYMNSLHEKFNEENSENMTMGCSYGDYHVIAERVLKLKPKHIIEYGPGFTTLLFLRVFEDLDYTPVFTSYENSSHFYKILTDNGFNPGGVIELVDMKIEDVGSTYHCTYIHDLEKHRDVDFIFIDGPGIVEVDGIRKPNINLNLKNLVEYLGVKYIKHHIDGRRETQKFYHTFFNISK